MRDLEAAHPADSEVIVSMKEFARLLHCSADTAKRWLTTSPNRGLVKVQHSKGGHWRVVLPSGRDSAAVCRLLRVLESLFHRKAVARQMMPVAVVSPAGSKQTTGVNEGWLWWDLNTLLCQVLHELGAEMRESVTPAHLIARLATLLDTRKDEELRESLATLVVTQAVLRLQKLGEKVTVPRIAEFIGMSESAIYLPPFGKECLASARHSAMGGTPTMGGTSVSGAVQSGLSIQRKDPRRYKDRKEGRQGAKEAAARHFLCWQVFDQKGHGRMATLCMVPEPSIPKDLRPRYPSKGQVWRPPEYSSDELNHILMWLGVNLPGNWHGIGNVAPASDGVGYQWYVEIEETYKGRGDDWKDVSQRMAAIVRAKLAGGSSVILNPWTDDGFLVPENVFGTI